MFSEFEKGNDVPLPHSFPIIADKIAGNNNRYTYRYDPYSENPDDEKIDVLLNVLEELGYTQDFYCEKCESKLNRTTKWKYHNNWFNANFVCKECGKKFVKLSYTFLDGQILNTF